MPRRTGRKKIVKRRPMRRRGGKRKKFVHRVRTSRTGMPDKYFVNLKFSQTLQMEAGSTPGSYGAAVFRGNSPRNPFFGAGDYFASEYTRFSAIYRYCKVVASSFKVQGLNYNQQPVQLILVPAIFSKMGSPDELISLRYAKQNRFTGYSSGGAGPLNSSISSSMWTSKIYGIPNLKYDMSHRFSIDNNPDIEEGITDPTAVSTPPNTWYWHLRASKPSSTVTGSVNYICRVTIWYKCVFYGKLNVNAVLNEDEEPEELGATGDFPLNLGEIQTNFFTE